jgi:lysylphosphatidylglycerol synthetase-like protein (DUF2156 family)
VFCHVSRPVAEILARRGFFINEMGPDIRIDHAGYDFKGAKKVNLRNAVNRMARTGGTIRECSLSEIGIAEVKTLSDHWRRTRQIRRREVAFLNRPLVLADEPDVRRFFAFDRHDRPLAFQFFDPIYDAGDVVGYLSQHSRHLPEADPTIQFALKSHAIRTFQQEGRRVLYLGLSPFAYIEDRDFAPRKNWVTRRLFRFAYTNYVFNRFFFPLQGIELHKREFRGVAEQSYFAFNRLPAVPRLLRLLVVCKII